ncbi:hypothetical protein SAMN05216257_10488 [Meinhardsimonia xiamenensis]|jgi:hypothetical protein|uniref:ribonucleoside-diphosphate reductase n=1 Tax=Meinhardsimonia xiamenensis TaxID=990712 RepID=A0A1G9DZG1_9RHOB|nr:ribonucleotide reductase [Meinhardsimonia xiamenensis]PRX29007.1 hypothetical protein LV81_02951 [Meinhardsimonia xiamenensis]SDK69267.1 hypothetical protein SAMN05216257_10488 [Meinhardsimonia xiamenensis]
MRQRLPERRPSETRVISWRGGEIAVTIGLDPATGAPREVFASGFRYGSDVAAALDDACVVISLALQWGARAEDLQRSLGRVEVATFSGLEVEAASVIGAVVDCLVERERSGPVA